ncbi:MAG: GAF domain-containing protein [Holophagaceae bacterium]|nr:GAF domain-containing protein [Holophagaceae bacterium]
MAEELMIVGETKEDKYQSLLPQISALIEDETDLIATLANVSAALATTFKWLWTGFYIIKDQQLVLGPFQGQIACTRISHGKGVCGTAWKENRTLIVSDVEKFPGHIACSSLSKSEIVVPLRNTKGNVVGVLDVDSEFLDCFDETDSKYLEEVAHLLSRFFE